MQIYYCDEWSDIHREPWNYFDEATAYQHHQKKQQYTAVLTHDEKPKYIVEVTEKWVSIGFYDEQVRKYLNYHFEIKSEGKLFLRNAFYWEFDGETDNLSSSLIMTFKEDGIILMEQRDFETGSVEERETEATLEKNWDVFPEFGQYTHLCRAER